MAANNAASDADTGTTDTETVLTEDAQLCLILQQFRFSNPGIEAILDETCFNFQSFASLRRRNIYSIVQAYNNNVAPPVAAHGIALDDLLSLRAIQLAMVLDFNIRYDFVCEVDGCRVPG